MPQTVTAIETIRLDEHPNLLWVRVTSDEGIVGLGETFFGAEAVEAHIHGYIAPYLLGRDALQIEYHSHRMTGYTGRGGSGAEMRATSAVDIALWDLWGQATDQPIHQLLGGASRERVRVYNTCAGGSYVRRAEAQVSANFGLGGRAARPEYEDLDAFLNRPDELAESLLEMGITGMKIWPFDYAAEATGGTHIELAALKAALRPFERVRAAVGDRIDIMCELHSLWNVPTARKICAALEPFALAWIEDPVRMTHLGDVGEVARAAKSPIAVGELLGGRSQYRDLIERSDVAMVIMDIVWGGGLTEARKVASYCDTHGLPFTAHDCTGPVALTVSTHLALHAPNTPIQEMVRAFYHGWYPDLVTALPPVADGFITAPEGAGLGLALHPDVPNRPDARVRVSRRGDV